jgi:hypothetical protein
MKKLIYILLASAFALFALVNTGCKKSSSTEDNSGGTPTPMGAVGNTFSGNVYGIDGFSGSVTKLENNVSTVRCVGTITDATMRSVVSMLNSNSMMTMNPTTGVFSVDLKAKFTTAGIIEYFASDGSASVLASYTGKVGDVYNCKTAEGNTITRKVTAVSTADDYFWGGMYIKTSTIKETSSFRGVDRIEYRVNHKFGLVGITVYLQDGTSYLFPVYSSSYNE